MLYDLTKLSILILNLIFTLFPNKLIHKCLENIRNYFLIWKLSQNRWLSTIIAYWSHNNRMNLILFDSVCLNNVNGLSVYQLGKIYRYKFTLVTNMFTLLTCITTCNILSWKLTDIFKTINSVSVRALTLVEPALAVPMQRHFYGHFMYTFFAHLSLPQHTDRVKTWILSRHISFFN